MRLLETHVFSQLIDKLEPVKNRPKVYPFYYVPILWIWYNNFT